MNQREHGPAGETAAEPDKRMTYSCTHQCGESVEWSDVENDWVHACGNEYCDMGGESYVTAWPKGFPEPTAVPEPVPTEGVGESVRELISASKLLVKSKGWELSEDEQLKIERRVLAAIKACEAAAPIAPAAEELIADLERALGNLIGTVIVHYQELGLHPLVRADVDAGVAMLARAEEYRKGAKK